MGEQGLLYTGYFDWHEPKQSTANYPLHSGKIAGQADSYTALAAMVFDTHGWGGEWQSIPDDGRKHYCVCSQGTSPLLLPFPCPFPASCPFPTFPVSCPFPFPCPLPLSPSLSPSSVPFPVPFLCPLPCPLPLPCTFALYRWKQLLRVQPSYTPSKAHAFFPILLPPVSF